MRKFFDFLKIKVRERRCIIIKQNQPKKKISYITLVLSIVSAVILSALSVITAATDILNFLPYALKIIIYTAAALLLGFAIYNTVIFIKSGVPKTKVDTLMHKTQIGGKIADNDMFRTVFFTYISFAINAGFAFIKGVAGWMTSSIWLIMLSAYYLILCIIKMTLLQSARKMRFAEDENEKKLREWTAYGHCGAMLMVLTLILQGTVILIINYNNGFSYKGTLIYAVAFYDFYCFISAVVYIIKERKKHSPIVESIKTVKLISSLMALLSLQTAMFTNFSDNMDRAFETRMNIIFGSAVCLFTFSVGLLMAIRAYRKKKEIISEINKK